MKNSLLIFILFGSLVQISCTKQEKNDIGKITKTQLMPIDHHSYAKPHQARIKHLDLEVNVSFEEKVLVCKATYLIESIPQAKEIIFDTRSLKINRITVNDSLEVKNYKLSKADAILGSALHIPISEGIEYVSIEYQTSTKAEALQWLTAQQTAGDSPFLFTQSQAILCRSWIPIQDSPNIKFTYDAKVKVPPGYLALMSATNPQSIDSTGIYEFNMDKPIPAYLMALAVGKLDFHAYDSITGLYAEPNTIKRAKDELEDLHLMVAAAENLYGSYLWGRFDVLILPPSFPFGGMENPKLTFATPTILAGDKSLTSLIAHELAHSWSGNLVTNATWEDFWLNEGFTVYFEYRIMEEVFGKPYADMLAFISQRELRLEVKEMLENDRAAETQLKLSLKGKDPDEGLTAIAYDKGYFFLKRLEALAGRENFDKFLNKYFNEFAFKTMNSENFIMYTKQHLFFANNLEVPNQLFERWVYGQGLPEDMPRIQSELFDQVDLVLEQWLQDKNNYVLPDSSWSTHEWLHFLHQLPDSISADDLDQLDRVQQFTLSQNSEIQTEWYLLALKHNYSKVLPYLEEFLVNTGRRKFLMPLYTALLDYNSAIARDIYKKARQNYHFVSYSSLDKLFGITDKK